MLAVGLLLLAGRIGVVAQTVTLLPQPRTCPPHIPSWQIIPSQSGLCNFFVGGYSTHAADTCLRDYNAWAGVLRTAEDVDALMNYMQTLPPTTRIALSGKCESTDKYNCTWMDGTTVEPGVLWKYSPGEPDSDPGQVSLGIIPTGLADTTESAFKSAICSLPSTRKCDAEVSAHAVYMSSIFNANNCPAANCIDGNFGAGVGDCSSVPLPMCKSQLESRPWIDVEIPLTDISAVRVFPTTAAPFSRFAVLTSVDRVVWAPCVSRGYIAPSPAVNDFTIPCSARGLYVRFQIEEAAPVHLTLREVVVKGCVVPTPTSTPSPTVTLIPSTATATASSSATPSTSRSATSTNTGSPTPSLSPSGTLSPTPTATATTRNTPTASHTPALSSTLPALVPTRVAVLGSHNLDNTVALTCGGVALRTANIALLDCLFFSIEASKPLDRDVHPLGVEVGSGDHRYFLGALVGNTALIAAFPVLGMVAGAIRMHVRQESWGGSIARLRTPGLVVFPMGVLLQATGLVGATAGYQG
eukprot:Sspe_Gene.63586::Locus_36615_Transcript_1_1_Confidence_1.000_Length_1604::g.63586::m.63586